MTIYVPPLNPGIHFLNRHNKAVFMPPADKRRHRKATLASLLGIAAVQPSIFSPLYRTAETVILRRFILKVTYALDSNCRPGTKCRRMWTERTIGVT